ncbi:MAG TPA: hypothetical protein VFL14_14165 [Xanthomonadales bacterium]|nr:hypothetical protein [Xanthomonadales bacterium]
MKRLALAILLAVTGAASVAVSMPAEARTRMVYVNDYDVVWRYGRPYYRVTREPVYVVRNYRGGPRYYYYANYDRPHRYHNRYNAWRDRDYDRRYYYDDDGARVRITYENDWDRP